MLALSVGVDQRGHDVVSGMLALPRRQLHGVPHQFARRGQRVVVGELRIVAADHVVRPVEQLVVVLLRHPEQTGDGLQRQPAGHLADKVARTSRRGFAHDASRPLREVGAQPLDRPWRKGA